jgi:hypothetical protein
VEAVEPILRPPQDDPAKWPSLALSATVHLLLIAALFLGVQWKSTPPSAVEVEVWRAVPAPTREPTRTQTGTPAGAQSRTKARTQSGAETRTQTGTKARTQTGTQTDSETGSHSGAET